MYNKKDETYENCQLSSRNAEREKKKIEVKKLLAKADDYFQDNTNAENYENAFGIYSSLYASGVVDPVLFQRLGYFYYNGCVVTKDIMKGITYYEKAAKLNDGDANAFLGRLYENGENVEKNIERAIFYYSEAAESGNIRYLHYIGELYREGIKISKNLTFAQIYHEQAIEKGYVHSYVPLALICEEIAKTCSFYEKQYHEKQAFYYLQEGYKVGAFGAACFLGHAYAFEIGVKHNYDLAIKYYKETIIEYKNVNVPAADIQYLEEFIKKIEAEDRKEKDILKGFD